MDNEEKQQHFAIAARLVSEQNFAAAVIAGAVAAVLAAVAYGITVARWPFTYGFAAAAIGIVVGLSMQFLGRGISTKFAVVAAVYTILGCALGAISRVLIEFAKAASSSPVDVLRDSSISTLVERAVAFTSPIILVYWFVAVFCAVFLVKRSLSRSERLAIGLYERGEERAVKR